MFKSIKSVLILIIFAVLLGFYFTEALQCYDCYDCEDGEDLHELQICGEFPMRPTTRTTTTKRTKITKSTTTNISQNTTRVPGNDDDSDELSDEDVVRKTTLRPGNTIPSRKTTTAATRRTTKKVDSDESDDNDESEDEEDRRLRRRRQQTQSRADDAVCYMVKLLVNDTIITKRGCATMVRGNNVQTCKSISSGWSLDDCQLCDMDGCNKFTDDDGSWEAIWNGGEQLGAGVQFIILTVLVKILL